LRGEDAVRDSESTASLRPLRPTWGRGKYMPQRVGREWKRAAGGQGEKTWREIKEEDA